MRHWIKDSSSWRLGVAIGVAVVLIKLPFVFTTLGEDDQGRLLMGALVYLEDGAKTLRQYGIFTSPLWSLMFAGVAAVVGAAHLVLISNLGGLLCGGATTGFAFVLLRHFGAARAWAAVGSLAAALVPGTFYLSLYGYPSQYALPLLLLAAVAFAQSLATTGAKESFGWYGLATVSFAGLALMKVDFALTGTLLLSVAIINKKILNLRTWLLPVVVLIGAGTVYLVTDAAIEGQNIIGFMKEFGGKHPWNQEAMTGDMSDTILYACGIGTLGLLSVTLIAGLMKFGERIHTLRVALAWAIAVVPLWAFWLAHPPMSTRHAGPGALLTALVAALLASRVLGSIRRAPFVWLVALVVINWPFGEPSPNFNYRPTGNLAQGLMVNRRAFAVTEAIGRDAAKRREPLVVVVGPRHWHAFYGIDFVPPVEIALASRSKTVRTVKKRYHGYEHIFTMHDGFETRMYPYMSVTQSLRYPHAYIYSPWKYDVGPLEQVGAVVWSRDPEELMGRIRPSGIYGFFSRGDSARTKELFATNRTPSDRSGSTSRRPSLLLFPNSPNPFSESTVIKFRLFSVEDVTISVHSSSGGWPVFSVELPNTPAGLSTYRYDGRDNNRNPLPPGDYYYQVKAGTAVQQGGLRITR